MHGVFGYLGRTHVRRRVSQAGLTWNHAPHTWNHAPHPSPHTSPPNATTAPHTPPLYATAAPHTSCPPYVAPNAPPRTYHTSTQTIPLRKSCGPRPANAMRHACARHDNGGRPTSAAAPLSPTAGRRHRRTTHLSTARAADTTGRWRQQTGRANGATGTRGHQLRGVGPIGIHSTLHKYQYTLTHTLKQ